MAKAVNHQVVSPWGRDEEVVEVIYDFAKDGGAQGAITLFTAGAAMVVTKAYVIAETGVTSSGSATIEIGKSGATAALVAQSAKTTVDTAGEVLAGVANLAYALAKDTEVLLTIGTADLTAGKLRCRFHVAAQA